MHAYCPLVLLYNERNSRSVDPKNDHLRALDGAADRLVLLRAPICWIQKALSRPSPAATASSTPPPRSPMTL